MGIAEEQQHDLATMVSKPVRLAVLIGQREVLGRSDFRPGRAVEIRFRGATCAGRREQENHQREQGRFHGDCGSRIRVFMK